jgi:hypothetical protein
VGLATQLKENFSIGVAGKFINRDLKDNSANTYAADAGVLWKLSPRLNVGGAIQNIGPAKAFIQEADPLPAVARTGLSYQIKKLLLLTDVSSGRDNVTQESVGAEYEINKYVKLRMGSLHAATLDFTGGLGIQFAGPKKALVLPPPPSPKVQTKKLPKPELVIPIEKQTTLLNEKTYQIVNKLTAQYNQLNSNLKQPRLGIFPLNSKDNPSLGSNLSDMLNRQFSELQEFTVIESSVVTKAMEDKKLDPSIVMSSDTSLEVGKQATAQLILFGSVEKLDDKFLIRTRFIQTADGKVLGTALEELPITTPQHTTHRLEEVAPIYTSGTNSAGMNPSEFSTIDFGLDYAVQSHSDLGISQTITLKLLY